MDTWYERLEHMKKKDEKDKWRRCISERWRRRPRAQKAVLDFSTKITKPTTWRGGTKILKKEEEGVRLLDRWEAKREEWAKQWQCDESVQKVEDKPRKNEELKRLEEALPRLKESLGSSVEIARGKNRSVMRRLPPESSL